MVDSQTRPLVICDAGGAPIDVVLENDKGFRKSIESGTLWTLHPDTSRLLPYAEGSAASVEDRTTWYRAVLTGTEPTASGAPIPGAPVTTSAPTPDAEPVPVAAAADDIGAVLSSLVAVIQDRRREMPEGSYTTHLFSAGTEKIRKKTGEEAVELILARDRTELTSEAADLIYHLLVLLEVEGVSLDEVAEELKRR